MGRYDPLLRLVTPESIQHFEWRPRIRDSSGHGKPHCTSVIRNRFHYMDACNNTQRGLRDLCPMLIDTSCEHIYTAVSCLVLL